MLLPRDLLEDAARGHDDSFLQIEKTLQKWNILQLAKAAYEESQSHQEVLKQKIKSATDGVRSDIGTVVGSIDDSMKGAWSTAVKEQVEKETKKFERFLTGS